MHVATPPNTSNTSLIDLAVEALRRGELVAFPTETVYGLGADASSVEALKRLYQVKGRPAEHPVIVHIRSAEQLADWVEDVPESACKLAEAFWPGPLTMVLRRSRVVLDQVTGGQETVAIRIPGHPLALALLESFGGGIAAPSANRFGKLSPTTADAVAEELGPDVAMVLDGGPCKVGIESTIVNLSGDVPEILRPGMILADQIEKVLGTPLRYHGTGAVAQTTEASQQSDASRKVVDARTPRAPGGLLKHYAPRTPMRLVSASKLDDAVKRLNAEGKRLAVVSFGLHPQKWPNVVWVSAPTGSVDYAHDLYGTLRHLDSQRCDLILVERVPESQEWTPIRDRLERASTTGSMSGDQT